MSKQVRWQVPFVSRLGTSYRVDIYDEDYTDTPVQLLGDTSPFTTDEDDSDDYFAPIRVQTGTLTVCTHDEDGNVLITLDDILPANNIARPVRLVNVGTGEIEWQGFLSCEAYDQEYTSIPQHLQLPVISVLEAMASVEVQLDESKAFLRILGHVCNAMKAIETESGMSNLWGSMYLSQYCEYEMVAKYFYSNVYFSTQEQISGDNIVVEIHSISCKDILSQVAQFFGGCWREKGKDLYFEIIGKSSAFTYNTFANIYNEMINGSMPSGWRVISMTESQASQLQWSGTGHQRTVAQGAKRVRVTAGLDDFECKMTLQECPVGSLVENPEARKTTWGEVHVNTNETFYSLAEHKHMLVKAVFPTDLSGASLQYVNSQSSINYSNTIFWTNNEFRTYYKELVVSQTKGSNSGINYWVTSFMSWYRNKDGELQSGLMICGIPKYLYWSYDPVQGRVWNKFALTESNYLFRQRTPLVFAATKGFLKIDIHTLAWSSVQYMPARVYGTYNGRTTITVALQFGTKWAYYDSSSNSYMWSNTFRTMDFPLEKKNSSDELKTLGNWNDSMDIDEGDGIFIEIPSFMVGFVSVYVYHEVDAMCADPYTAGMFDVFINKLDIEYVPLKTELLTDRSENIYAQNLSTGFRDEIETGVEIATDSNNTKLATMLWERDGTTPVKLLTLGTDTIRPEVDLLNRLAAYYGAARQRLDLIVEHPTGAPLPLLRLNGISPDTRKYLPLAESRDWKKDTSTIKCFETI